MRANVKNDIIRKIVELTLRGASSADNQQPWSFHWDGVKLTVREVIQGLKLTDPGRFLNTLNLGTIAETIDIVTSMPSVHLKPEFSYSLSPANLGMQATFTKSPRSLDELAQVVEKRWCDRRKYKSESIDESVIQACHRDLYDGVNLYFSANTKELHAVDGMIWGKVFAIDRLCKKDMYEWLRWSKRDAEKTRDGMYWTTFSDSWINSRMVKLSMNPSRLVYFCTRPFTRPALRAIGILQRMFSASNGLISEGTEGVYGCVTVKKTSSEALVDAGRSIIRVWMRLNLQGYSFQPMMVLPLVFSYMRPEAGNGSGVVKGMVSAYEIDKGFDACRETFGFSKDETPVWIFRAGLPKGPKHYATLRKDVAKVLSVSPGITEK
ncbi:MAG: hypothetical protein HY756_04825 [Nitrospirae bacterium]|nr:hypothetical protein [Nitrospirota bacterium]